MKILFLSHLYKGKHDLLVRGISEALNSQDCLVVHEPIETEVYDCILVFNRKALEKHEDMLREKQSPVIYMFCLSDVAKEYTVSNVVDQTVVFKDKSLNINYLSNAFFLYEDMVFPTYNQRESTSCKDKPMIYVRIENDYLNELTFIKLLPLLNRMENFMIHYQSDNGIDRILINRHI